MQTETKHAPTVTEARVVERTAETQPSAHGQRVPNRRHRVWVNTNQQLPLTASVFVSAICFILLFNLSVRMIFAGAAREVAAIAPHTAAVWQQANQVFTIVGLVTSVAFVLTLTTLAVRHTHQTFGPLVNIHRHLKYAQQERFNHRIRLRKNDQLHELAGAINAVLESLSARALQDRERLEALAARVQHARNDADRLAISQELQGLARAKEQAATTKPS